MKLGLHRRLAHKIGYDIDKFNRQLTVESHLRALLPTLDIDLVLDVGANQGQFVQMLRYVGYQGEVMSFEPGSEAFRALQKAVVQDDQWQAFNIALGDTEVEAELHLSQASVFNSLHATNEFGRQKFGGRIASADSETVTVQRLDRFLDEYVANFKDLRVFLKMDTQGHDSAIFEGAGEYRAKFSGIQSEIAVTPIYEDIPDYMTSLTLYRSYGYEVTGMYTVKRHLATGHVVEFDCVMAPAR